MRASQLGLGLTEYIAQLIQRDADEAGLSKFVDSAKKEADRDR